MENHATHLVHLLLAANCDITQYTQTCHVCLRGKTPHHKPHGLLKPLPIGKQLWSSISMDHIVELLDSNGYNAILVVVCHLMKQAIFIPCHGTDSTSDFARMFIHHVFSKHSLLADIISDCGPLFISLEIPLQGARHSQQPVYCLPPRTDRQTERDTQAISLDVHQL